MIQEAHAQRRPAPRRRVRSAGYLLGAGLAGLLDSILFADLLGWHHFVDAPGRAAAISDGLFGLGAWVLVAAAVALLWRARLRFSEPGAGSVLAGSALVGAGALQLFDQLVDHAALRLHVLHPQSDALAWEIGYLVVSALLVGAGAWTLWIATRRREGTRRRGRARRGRPT